MSAVKGQFFEELVFTTGLPYISPVSASLRWVRTGTTTPVPVYSDRTGTVASAQGLCQTDAKGNLVTYLDTDVGPLDLIVVIQILGGPAVGTVLIQGREIADLDPQVTGLLANYQAKLTDAGAYQAGNLAPGQYVHAISPTTGAPSLYRATATFATTTLAADIASGNLTFMGLDEAAYAAAIGAGVGAALVFGA